MGPFRAKVYHKEQREAEKRQSTICKNCKEPGHTMSSCPEPQRCFDCGLPEHKRGDPACLHIVSDSDAQQEPAPQVDTEATLSPSPELVIDQYFSQYVSREDRSSPTEDDNTSVNVTMTTEPDPSWARASASDNPRKTSQKKKKQPASQKRPRDSPPAVASEPSRKQLRNAPPPPEDSSGGAT
uniref:CCHC-type domain-containing protein n=1 Tax=Branchiostoma floridae TaxID=7739 RepID=C3YXZ4_BRAFL|eukprot:XP_002598941.1 hypothetical protein BRAFLDRAFT_79871 [Branchiostoma floridae]